jgi:SulP family sulfate permease
MVVTVVVVVATSDLAIGVVAGVVLAALLFARRVAHLAEVDRELVEHADGTAHAAYRVSGELFFASSNDLCAQFDYTEDPDRVVIDLTDAHIWDASTVAALDAVTTKYRHHGTTVEVRGLDEASTAMYQRLSGHLTAAH